jgi:hypothetical protein
MSGRGRIDHPRAASRVARRVRSDPEPADRPGRQRPLRHRLRSRPQHLLPRPGRPRGRGVHPEPRRRARSAQSAGHSRRPVRLPSASRRTAAARRKPHWRILRTPRSGRSECGHTCGHHRAEADRVGDQELGDRCTCARCVIGGRPGGRRTRPPDLVGCW